MLLPKLGGSRLLPPWDFPHLYVRVTLWTTTAFHLDTPNNKLDTDTEGAGQSQCYRSYLIFRNKSVRQAIPLTFAYLPYRGDPGIDSLVASRRSKTI